MRQRSLPGYGPTFPAPERAVLSILHAALDAAERILCDEHPAADSICHFDARREPVADVAARLVVRRCNELRSLLDFYDGAIDRRLELHDDMPF